MISKLYEKYNKYKEKYPNKIVLQRLGDFYEILGQESKQVAEILDLTLTSRDVGLEERILMAGFPYHIANEYIQKLIDNNLSIVKIESENCIEFYEPKEEKIYINDNTYINKDGEVIKIEKNFINNNYNLNHFQNYTRLLIYNPLEKEYMIIDSNNFFKDYWQALDYFNEKELQLLKITYKDDIGETNITITESDKIELILKVISKKKAKISDEKIELDDKYYYRKEY